jgi:hypothetical protein
MIKICTDTRNQCLGLDDFTALPQLAILQKHLTRKWQLKMTFDGWKRTIVKQGSTNAMRQIAAETKFCKVTPNISGPSVQNLFRTTLLGPRTLIWLPDYLNI